MPDPGNERAVRAVFRDFALDPALPVQQVCDFYGLPVPARAELPLAAWIAHSLRRPPVAGDSVPLGSATLVVRDVAQGRISAVGLGLPD
jgi:potassium/hydrogen antiporter